MHRHVLITGAVDAGKTTVISRILSSLNLPVYGYCSQCPDKSLPGHRQFRLNAPGAPEQGVVLYDGDRTGRKEASEILDTVGCELLNSARPGGIILMDEIGLFESDAPRFSRKILELFDGNLPILAAVKAPPASSALLEAVRTHPSARLYTLTPENRDALPGIILNDEWLL